jgi:hypothetical protein
LLLSGADSEGIHRISMPLRARASSAPTER